MVSPDIKFKVWIVDDDFLFRLLCKKLVNTVYPNSEITEFEDGAFLIDAINSLPDSDVQPDLILLDINMPKVDGWDVLDFLLQQNFKMPPDVFMVSSSIDPLDKQNALAYQNVQRYLVKPLKLIDLQ